METFLNSLNEGILILDKDLSVVFCNYKFWELVKKANKKNINPYLESKDLIKNLQIGISNDIVIELCIENEKIKIHTDITKDENQKTYILVKQIIRDIDNIDKNIKKEIYTSNEIIQKLSNVLLSIKEGKDISDILKSIDIEGAIQTLIDEVKKIELIKKDLDVFLSISADIIGVVDTDAKIISFAKEGVDILGFNEGEMKNINVLDLIEEKQKDEFKQILENKTEEVRYVENKVICKDGNYKWLRWNLRYIKERNVVIFAIRDIDKEKQDIGVRQKLEQDIHLECMKNEFFANISHEFKTPLNIMLGTIQLLDINIDKGKIQFDNSIDLNKYVFLLKQNSYRLLKLVNNLIDITKIDAGYYQLELGNYNIVSIIEDISVSVIPYSKNKNIDLIFDTSCEELVLACDPEKIERILLNLLSNAIKHTDENGTVYVNIQDQDDVVKVCVQDNGEGISNDKLQDIFERFTQAKSKLTNSYEGSGIGLSLVKSLVNMHNGDIDVYSELGKGSKFEFYLPKVLVNKEKKTKTFAQDNNKIERCKIEFSDIYK